MGENLVSGVVLAGLLVGVVLVSPFAPALRGWARASFPNRCLVRNGIVKLMQVCWGSGNFLSPQN
jgi:hypothetical protein